MHKYTEILIERGNKSASWLNSMIDTNGNNKATDDLGSYYKCVYPLRCAGYSYKASMVLKQIMKRFLTDSGDLRYSSEKKTKEPYTSRYSQTYPNGWVCLGAELLGQYDIVRKLNDGLIRNYFDDQIGSFRTCALPKTEVFDSNSAATATLCLSYTDMDKAKRAADFLIRHLKEQPDKENCFYINVKKPFTYITEPDMKYPGFNIVRFGQEGQATWVLGLPSAALAKLYQITGDIKYLDGSIEYFETFLKIGEPAFRSYGAGKAMWAASMLFRLTGEKKYEEACIRLAQFFFSIQADDGSFPMKDINDPDFEGYMLIFDTSPEYCRWFFEVAAELNGI